MHRTFSQNENMAQNEVGISRTNNNNSGCAICGGTLLRRVARHTVALCLHLQCQCQNQCITAMPTPARHNLRSSAVKSKVYETGADSGV